MNERAVLIMELMGKHSYGVNLYNGYVEVLVNNVFKRIAVDFLV